MLLQQRDNFPPAFFTTFLSASSFCLGVFGRSPSLNCLFGGEEHGDTSVQQRGGGKQERGGYYYNAGLVGG